MHKHVGFTLIEVMIAVAIVAILAAIAYPSYFSHVQSVRCEEAKRTLVEAAQHMESFYAMNLNYSNSLTGTVPTGYQIRSEFSDHYALSAAVTSNSYTLTATPSSATGLGALSLNNTGVRTPASGGCW